MHKHKCDSCKCVWEHEDDCSGVNRAHECPQCGAEQYAKYLGYDAPGFSQSCSPPTRYWSNDSIVTTTILLGFTP